MCICVCTREREREREMGSGTCPRRPGTKQGNLGKEQAGSYEVGLSVERVLRVTPGQQAKIMVLSEDLPVCLTLD